MDYIVIADPTRVEVGFWFRDVGRVWGNEIFQEPASVIDMPGLGLAITLATLYERAQVTPRPRPRLVWEDGNQGTTAL